MAMKIGKDFRGKLRSRSKKSLILENAVGHDCGSFCWLRN
jgi:hypothetical protein